MTDEEKKQLHLQTIKTHIACVQEMCDKLGIHEIGLEHDKSKYSKEEFEIYKYADGKKSPHDNARAILGYSPSWCYHKARNEHHWEFWLDFNEATPNGDGTFTVICKPVKMPYNRVIEMVADFIGAGKAYSKEKWTCRMPLDYYKEKCEGTRAMHPTSEYLFVRLLEQIDHLGLDVFVYWYNQNKEFLQQKYEKDENDY